MLFFKTSISSNSNSTTGARTYFSFSVEGSKVGVTMDLGAKEVELGSGARRVELGVMRRARGVVNFA